MGGPNGAKIEKAGGASLSYARPPVGTYGTRGKIRPFWCAPEFVPIVDAAFNDLWRICPLGRAEVVASAGFFVEKSGEHARGMAMDVDAIFWPSRDFVTLNFAVDPAMYFAVEAVLRRHFGVILDFAYNSAHHDHFHVDCSAPVGFRKANSIAGFLKASARRVLGLSIKETPLWDAEADEAAVAVRKACNFTGDWNSPDNWKRFLELYAKLLFARASLGATEAAEAGELKSLVEGVYATIAAETGIESASRKRLEGAVAGLLMHPRIHAAIYDNVNG